MDRLIEVLIRAGEQSPVAVLMGAVVWIFVEYLKRRDKQSAEREAQFLTYMQSRDDALAVTLREMGSECHAVQRQAVESLDRNTVAWGKAQQALENSAKVSDKAARTIEKHAATLKP